MFLALRWVYLIIAGPLPYYELILESLQETPTLKIVLSYILAFWGHLHVLRAIHSRK